MRTFLAGSVSAAPIVGYEQILTVETFNSFTLFGATMGFWLALGGAISLVLILLLNLTKLFKEWFGSTK